MARFDDEPDESPSGMRLLIDARFLIALLFLLSAVVSIATFRDTAVTYVQGTYPPAAPSDVIHLEVTTNDEVSCNATVCARHLRNTTCLDKDRMDQFYLFNFLSTVATMLCAVFTLVAFIVARGCPDIPIPWAELLYMTFVVVYPLVTALSLVSLFAIVYVRADPTAGKPDCDDIADVPLRFAGGFAAHVLKTVLSFVAGVGGIFYLVYLCCCADSGSGDGGARRRGGDYEYDPPTRAARADDADLTADEQLCARASRWNVLFGLLTIATFGIAAFTPAPLLTGHNPDLYGNTAGVATFATNATLYVELRYAVSYGCTKLACGDIEDLSTKAKALSDHVRHSKLAYYVAAGGQVLTWFLSMDNAIVVSARKSALSPLAYGSALAAFVVQLAVFACVCVAAGFIGAAQNAEAGMLASAGKLEFAVGSAVVVTSGAAALVDLIFALIAFLARRRARRAAKDGMDAGLLEERPRNVRYM
eukprot:CAMPEP_0174842276 /NCGR_PEP_ID=MMETSP1114-20130205/9811_1 /TAXON_ID=312471 /ORGANISM="Neobodo designis, Strain CCAP 1951/1" /LENGTH=475 /DNA_ID=CAMNT_0016076475 /DNA_START=43 /DNA_END=1470 /DNA_ORIENTATION=+